MRVIVSDTSKFEQINIEEDKQFNSFFKSEKKIIDLMIRLKNKGRISEKAAYESFSIFDQIMYRKIDSVGKCSLFGPILANVFLCRFEKHVTFYTKFFKDILLIMCFFFIHI